MTAAKKLLKVQVTGLLRQVLAAEGADPDHFAEQFAQWKQDWPAQEFTNFYFGKDGDYARPVRNGQRVLRHVHLPPAPGSLAFKTWELRARRGSRKTSDAILVYAQDPSHGYLLLFIAREPHGHSLGDMGTPDIVKLMNGLADTAEQFMFTGSVII